MGDFNRTGRNILFASQFDRYLCFLRLKQHKFMTMSNKGSQRFGNLSKI